MVLQYKTVPHITLKSIAQNHALDPIFDKWTPILAEKLAALNASLGKTATKNLRQQLLTQLECRRAAVAAAGKKLAGVGSSL